MKSFFRLKWISSSSVIYTPIRSFLFILKLLLLSCEEGFIDLEMCFAFYNCLRWIWFRERSFLVTTEATNIMIPIAAAVDRIPRISIASTPTLTIEEEEQTTRENLSFFRNFCFQTYERYSSGTVDNAKLWNCKHC